MHTATVDFHVLYATSRPTARQVVAMAERLGMSVQRVAEDPTPDGRVRIRVYLVSTNPIGEFQRRRLVKEYIDRVLGPAAIGEVARKAREARERGEVT